MAFFIYPYMLIVAYLKWMQNYNTTPREISLPIDKKYKNHKLSPDFVNAPP